MTTMTKERAQEIFLGNGPEPTASEERELARIALASFEAEPVAWTEKCEITNMQATGLYLRGFPDNSQGRNIALYTDLPAPVVPDDLAKAFISAIEKEQDRLFDEDYLMDSKDCIDVIREEALRLSACRAAMLQGSQPVNDRDELREQVRREHAEWSDATFGNVGPVGPLKHLSKEALEAAAEPGDLSEWADMQFLLWDAQRRAGISDEQINQSMVEKLAVNKQREWPEPKDDEPRLHIKGS
ncbi:DUF550 domain-containing protein [Citrobacter sedlakii]|nr:DUF550 domain-containing protein [Citrobacter sedlakii]MCZ4677235.1 DUF550 domain-containing protein [Citrobacter sedlakii]